ncbi:MAG: hypothetical protein F6K42_01560 [Leptolyngbya sp. SIO1D8]|nr:hypothetical protein [Leptolyngbya sp. SIO1D8]
MHYKPFPIPVVEIFPHILNGIVEKEITLNDIGRVRCQGISWRARLHQPELANSILPGEVISVIGRENNTLLVLPEAS